MGLAQRGSPVEWGTAIGRGTAVGGRGGGALKPSQRFKRLVTQPMAFMAVGLVRAMGQQKSKKTNKKVEEDPNM